MAIANNAAFYRRVGDILTQWGWGPYLNWWSGWATRSNSGATMVPQGVTVHHTGARATATSYLVNPTDRPLLKALANIHVDMLDKRIRFICAGGASHAGYGYEANYKKMIAGTAPLDGDMKPGSDSKTFSANKRTVGIEVDGAGGANEWDTWTYRATVAVAAACQLAGKWPIGKAPRVMAHKELTKRKPGDPYCNMGRFRQDVLACLKAPWGPTAAPAYKLGDRVLSKKVGEDVGPDVAQLAEILIAKGYDVGTPKDVFGPKMHAAIVAEQTKAGLTPHGIVSPATLAALLAKPTPVEPEPTPEPPVVVEPEPKPETPKPNPAPKGIDFRYGWANLRAQRWGGLADSSAKRADFIKSKLNPSLFGGCEMSETARIATYRRLGSWKNYPVGYVTSGWDPKKWTHIARKSVTFGTAYHGAVRAELKHNKTGEKIDIISVHVRPRASFKTDAAAAAGKQADIKKATSLIRKGIPTIFAGDFNASKTDLAAKAGLRLATPKVATSGTYALDQVWISKEIGIRKSTLVSPGSVSDHKAWLFQGTILTDTR